VGTGADCPSTLVPTGPSMLRSAARARPEVLSSYAARHPAFRAPAAARTGLR
jgi:hypothetical protein